MQGSAIPLRRQRLAWFIGVGWLIGLLAQVATRLWSGYMDVSPPQLLLGALLCGGAGAAVRGTLRGRRSVDGLLGGAGLAASIVAGYAALTAVLWNPAWSAGGADPWQGAVLEALVAMSVALVLGAACGLIGWRIAARRH